VKPDHLFKGTHASNVEDKVNKKRQTWGEKNPRAELTVAQVAWIRKHYVPHPGKYSGKAIAKKFNVARSTISYIVNDQHWTIGMN
jgi:predicted DNA binding protein